jgi:hypothetical protein
MVVGEASLPSRRVVKEGDGEAVPLSCERWQLFSMSISAMEGCSLESPLVALNRSFRVALHQC